LPSGSKFRAVASIDSARERFTLQRYLDSMEKADEEQLASIDPSAVQAALETLKQHPEPEAGFMLMRTNALPAYNVQTAVDAEQALIIASSAVLDAADNRCLQPMAEAAKKAIGVDSFHIVGRRAPFQRRAGGKLRSGRYASACPAMRTVNTQGDGSLFGRKDFQYQSSTDTYLCRGNIVRTVTPFMRLRQPTGPIAC
jgi:transposase